MKHFKLSRGSTDESDNPLKACIIIDYCPVDCSYSEYCDICPDYCNNCEAIIDICMQDCFASDCDAYYCGNVEFGLDGCVCNGDTCNGFDTCESDII